MQTCRPHYRQFTVKRFDDAAFANRIVFRSQLAQGGTDGFFMRDHTCATHFRRVRGKDRHRIQGLKRRLDLRIIESRLFGGLNSL